MDGKYTKLNMLEIALTIMLLLGSGLKGSVPVIDDSKIVESPYYYLMKDDIRLVVQPEVKADIPTDAKDKPAYVKKREEERVAYVNARIDDA